jgi:hypothetical protein
MAVLFAISVPLYFDMVIEDFFLSFMPQPMGLRETPFRCRTSIGTVDLQIVSLVRMTPFSIHRCMKTHFLVSAFQNRHHQYSVRKPWFLDLLLIDQKLSTKGQNSLYSSVERVKGDSIVNSRFRMAWTLAGALITGQGVEERVELGVDILSNV